MVFEHDYINFPELTNKQISEFGFTSPHKQIVEDFPARVVKVSDGDTITLRATFRDFDFPLRFLSVDAPELSTGDKGAKSKDWLKEFIEDQLVDVKINRENRVGKFGRLLGDVVFKGLNMGDLMVQKGLATPFGRRREDSLPVINKELSMGNWL